MYFVYGLRLVIAIFGDAIFIQDEAVMCCRITEVIHLTEIYTFLQIQLKAKLQGKLKMQKFISSHFANLAPFQPCFLS